MPAAHASHDGTHSAGGPARSAAGRRVNVIPLRRPVVVVHNAGSNWRDLPPPAYTSVLLSVRLAARLLAGFAGRRRAGSLPAFPASFLDALQGTFEKIKLQRLPRH